MAFTEKDRQELERARRLVAELEVKEAEMLTVMRGVLWAAGLRLAPDGEWASIAAHADAIRDALEPFDSGARHAPEAAR